MSNPKPVAFVLSIPSFSNPEKKYEVRQFTDGSRWCSCPAYKYQKKNPANRSCKHTVLIDSYKPAPRAAQESPELEDFRACVSNILLEVLK